MKEGTYLWSSRYTRRVFTREYKYEKEGVRVEPLKFHLLFTSPCDPRVETRDPFPTLRIDEVPIIV